MTCFKHRLRRAAACFTALMLALWQIDAPAFAAQPPIDQPIVGPHSEADMMTNYLNPTLEAMAGCWSGTTAPANGPGAAPVAYQCWVDTSTSPPTYRIYGGSGNWSALGTIGTAANSFILALQAPTVSALGGIKAINPVTSNWIKSIGTDGTPVLSQPQATDILFTPSGSGASPRSQASKNAEIVSISDYGAAASSLTATCNVTASSATLAGCAGNADFLANNGVLLPAMGLSYGLAAPTGFSVTACGSNPYATCTTGSASYAYTIACADGKGGVGVALTQVAIANGPATLSVKNYNALAWTPPSGSSYCIVYGRASGFLTPLQKVVGGSWNDYGLAGLAAEYDLPASPPAVARPQDLVTTIVSNGGASMQLAAAAVQSGSSVTLYHDNTPNIQAALAANSYVTVPCGTFPIDSYGMSLVSNNTLKGADWRCASLKMLHGIIGNSPLYEINASNVALLNLTLDANNYAADIGAASFGGYLGTNIELANLNVINYDKFALSLNGGTNILVHDNRLIRNQADFTQNQCLNAGASAGNLNGLVVSHNRCDYSGMIVQAVDPLIEANEISYAGFGAGLALNNATNSYGCRALSNHIRYSGTTTAGGGIDTNNDVVKAVEGWCQNQILADNVMEHNIGGGIVFIAASTITGNIGLDNGGYSGAQGYCIYNLYSSSSANGNGSVVTGNKCLDDGAGVQNYGYGNSPSSTGTYVGLNAFAGNVTGAVNQQGTDTILSLGGSLTTAGNVTISGAYGLAFTLTGATALTLPVSGTLASLSGTNTWTGVNTISNSTPSTSTGSGALVVAGGVGIGGALYTGSDANIHGATVGLGGGGVSTNVAFGNLALLLNVSGTNNMALGVAALSANTGSNNIGIGTSAASNNTSGGSNIGIGSSALGSNVAGSSNVAIGGTALYDQNGSGANNNTAIGNNTGRGITTGSNNTIVGAGVTGLSSNLTGAIIFATGDGTIRMDYNRTVSGAWSSLANNLVSGKHFAGNGTAPGLTSCGSGSPAVSTGANDIHGTVTEGTSATGCVLTFNVAYANAPDCVVTSAPGNTLTSFSVSASALTLVNPSASGNKYTYHCEGL